MLNKILQEALEIDMQMQIAAIPSDAVLKELFPISINFDRRMKILLSKKKKCHGMRRVAMSAAVIAIIILTTIATMPRLRATIIETIKGINKVFVSFSFPNDKASDLVKEYYLGYIPEGYEVVHERHDKKVMRVVYEKGKELLSFSVGIKYSGRAFNIDSEHSDYSKEEIGGLEVEAYRCNTIGYSNYIIWREDNMIFYLSNDHFNSKSFEELVKVFKNIKIK